MFSIHTDNCTIALYLIYILYTQSKQTELKMINECYCIWVDLFYVYKIICSKYPKCNDFRFIFFFVFRTAEIKMITSILLQILLCINTILLSSQIDLFFIRKFSFFFSFPHRFFFWPVNQVLRSLNGRTRARTVKSMIRLYKFPCQRIKYDMHSIEDIYILCIQCNFSIMYFFFTSEKLLSLQFVIPVFEILCKYF